MDYLERKAVVTAVEIQRDINKVDSDLDYFEGLIERLKIKRIELINQRDTLESDYRKCEL